MSVSTTNSSKFTEDTITHQCNLIHIAERYGYIPSGNIRTIAEEILDNTLAATDPLSQSLLRVANARTVFIKHLEQTLKPLLYGISRVWRKTQGEAISAHIKSFERGYTRLLSEIPTGAGKSMIIGAFVRSALDTMKELNLDFEIQIFTSRIAIAGQLIDENVSPEEEEDQPLEIGKKGDVRLWCPELSDDSIRVLAGSRGSSQRELSKDAVITVSTYQGLRAGRINQHFKKPVFITICDESHRVTERVSMLLEQLRSFVIGMSATVLGPQRDPFTFFERVERSEIDGKKKTYIDYLCYYKSLAEMIKDQEFKPVRWITSRSVKINVSAAKLNMGKSYKYDVLNDESIAQIISKNAEVAVEILGEAYLREHLGLEIAGSKPIWQRRGIAYVNRVSIARELTELCNKMLPEKITAKYGERAYFKADYVDGSMPADEYEHKIREFRSGRTTIMFSVKKISEGNDFPFVDFVVRLKVLGYGSQWELVQEIGRGGRIDPEDPLNDLVILDLVFESDRHLLASVLGIFGRSTSLSGGLLVGWGSNYELEQKVFDLLRNCKTWTELWGKLSPEEQELFPYIRQKILEEKMRGHTSTMGSHSPGSNNYLTLGSIDFIEHDDIRFAISLGNPEEMIKYTIEVLKAEGFGSIERLINIRNSSIHLFARHRFGSFRDGKTMVSLNIKRTLPELTASAFTEFIDLLREYGFATGSINLRREEVMKPVQSQPRQGVELVKERSSKKSVTQPMQRRLVKPILTSIEALPTLIKYTRDLFGVEPEITTVFKDLHSGAYHSAQSFIALPEGLKYCSAVYRNADEAVARQHAAAELNKVLEDQMNKRFVRLYRGTTTYQNYLKALQVVRHEQRLDEVVYTITHRDGIYVVQASVAGKTRYIGAPRVHSDELIAKQHAEVALMIALIEVFPIYGTATKIFAGNTHMEELKKACKSSGIPFTSASAEITVGKYIISKVTLTWGIYQKTGFGISFDHAREKAARDLVEVVNSFDHSS